VLVHSHKLSDADLIENASTKSEDHLMPSRGAFWLSERVTDVLIERGNRRVIHKVSANKGTRFSLTGYDTSPVARRDRKLTLALARRHDMRRQYFLKLLENASGVRVRQARHSQPRSGGRHSRCGRRGGKGPAARSAQHHAALRQGDARRQSHLHRALHRGQRASPAHAQEFTRT